MRLLMPIFGIFLLAACATSVNTAYITQMNGYTGLTERELIDEMGTPDKSYSLDNYTKVVTYVQTHAYRSSGGFDVCMGGFNSPFGYSACQGASPGRYINEYCEVNFNIFHGKVDGWSQKGNDCPRIK